jgi:hypothetical protein
MNFDNMIAELMIVPDKIFCEMHAEGDACDVIVQMENGAVFTALFATIPYIHRQMQLTRMMTESNADTPIASYAVLDTPHVIVDSLERITIEDAIDNLVLQDIFESLFTRVTEEENESEERTITGGKRTTQAVAAVVIEDVLVVDGAE